MADALDRATREGWDNTACRGNRHCPPRCPRFFDDAGVPIVIRPFRDDDFGPLMSMYRAIDTDDWTMGLPPTTASATEAWLETLTSEGWNLVAVAPDGVVGHVGIAPADVDEPQLVVFIHPSHQGRGVGSELLDQVIAHAADRGHDALELAVAGTNRHAVRLYRSTGFEPSEGSVEDKAALELEMRLTLSRAIVDRVQRPPAER